MNVRVLSKTTDPEKVICQAARNDYMEKFVGQTDFGEVMQGINTKPEDREWAENHFEGSDMDFERTIMEHTKRRALIRQLLSHGHYGPFEHPQITFAIEGISRSCMAQITRHRHVSFDVQSQRYVSFDDMDPGDAVIDIPELDDPGTVGRNAEFDEGVESWDDDLILKERRNAYEFAVRQAFRYYESLLEKGVAPENARMVLPIGTKVNMVMSMNARMLMHVADMRAAGDAQWEIREMTEEVLDLAEEWCPITFDYYNENMKGRKNRLAP